MRLPFALLLALMAAPAGAQERPRQGGELVFVVPAEPPSYDAHREGTFALIHPTAPHYNTLLRIDPNDRTGTRIVGDLAESWTVVEDGRIYAFKLRRGVKFHDGSEMTSRDVKASYDKIIFPPSGVASNRKGIYVNVEAVEAPDRDTVVFRLTWPQGSFLSSLASPFSWIYKADILERDMRWYETHVMGTGPFVFVEHVKGSHWVGRRNPNYWDRGKPHLDGYRALFIKDAAAQVAAVRGERAHIQFRGFSPAERESLVGAMGAKVTVQESPWDCDLLVAMNHERKPFDDRRVRRALTLALDRHEGAQALSRIAIVKAVAGVPDGFAFTFKNRAVPMPYEPLGVWLIDQWRRVGLTVRQEVLETAKWVADNRGGDFEVSMDAQCGFMVEPDLDLYKFQSTGVSHNNYGRYTDRVLDELYARQSRAVDPEERKRLVREFEKRLLDEEAHYLYTLQWHRIVPHSARVRGWTITPSHFLNQQLDTVWLSE